MINRITPILFHLLLITIFFSCSTEKKETVPPNIVWITSEDNSKHYMKLFDENGIETPFIDSLAQQGITFTHAFSNAPVCSVARSTLITGCYAPRIGAQFHRKIAKVPLPENMEMFPAYLKQAGYYTTNNSKEDYNLPKADSVWDDSSNKASWKENLINHFFMWSISLPHMNPDSISRRKKWKPIDH